MKIRIKHFLPMVALVILASCKITLVPKYDAVVYKSVKDGQEMTELLFKAENAVYNDSLYNILATQINNIRKSEESRLKSKPLVNIVDLLKKNFDKYRAQHRAKGVATEADFKIWLLYLRPYWKDLLIAEDSLKH